MTSFLSAPSSMPLLIVEIMSGIAIGAGIGATHYYLLWRNVEMLVSSQSLKRAMALQIIRLFLTGAALYLIARFGALPLVAAALGLVGARVVVVRRIGAGE